MGDIEKAADHTETSSKTSETSPDSFHDGMEDSMQLDSDQEQEEVTPIKLNAHSTDHGEIMDPIMLHSAELWFAECRNCPCCQGFKHGCMMCASKFGSFTCMCVATCIQVSCSPDDVSIVTVDEKYSSQRSKASSGRHRKSGRSKRTTKRDRKQREIGVTKGGPCRFFFSANGCRSGKACPFDHTKQEA